MSPDIDTLEDTAPFSCFSTSSSRSGVAGRNTTAAGIVDRDSTGVAHSTPCYRSSHTSSDPALPIGDHMMMWTSCIGSFVGLCFDALVPRLFLVRIHLTRGCLEGFPFEEEDNVQIRIAFIETVGRSHTHFRHGIELVPSSVVAYSQWPTHRRRHRRWLPRIPLARPGLRRPATPPYNFARNTVKPHLATATTHHHLQGMLAAPRHMGFGCQKADHLPAVRSVHMVPRADQSDALLPISFIGLSSPSARAWSSC